MQNYKLVLNIFDPTPLIRLVNESVFIILLSFHIFNLCIVISLF